jgi:hypothetical protein
MKCEDNAGMDVELELRNEWHVCDIKPILGECSTDSSKAKKEEKSNKFCDCWGSSADFDSLLIFLHSLIQQRCKEEQISVPSSHMKTVNLRVPSQHTKIENFVGCTNYKRIYLETFWNRRCIMCFTSNKQYGATQFNRHVYKF